MKRKEDPRHQNRIKIVKKLFSYSFPKPKKVKKDLLDKDIDKVLKNLEKVDNLIKKAAKDWPIEKIGKIDLAILRLAVYELAISQKEPPKVIIDEAVEIAKEFGNETSSKFINGTLGTIFQWIRS